MTAKCTNCKKDIIQGSCRYNYPAGTLCMKCGDSVNSILECGEKCIELYKKLTGYEGIRVKCF